MTTQPPYGIPPERDTRINDVPGTEPLTIMFDGRSPILAASLGGSRAIIMSDRDVLTGTPVDSTGRALTRVEIAVTIARLRAVADALEAVSDA